MKITITEDHLNRALSVPWSTETCILSQAADDAGFKGTESTAWLVPHSITSGTALGQVSEEAAELMILFDKGHQDEGRPDLIAQLRALLPVTVEV